VEKNWLPVPSEVSTKLRIMPNLLRLTWNDRPMAFEANNGWGYYLTDEEYKQTEEYKIRLNRAKWCKRKRIKGKDTVEDLEAKKDVLHFVKIPHKVRIGYCFMGLKLRKKMFFCEDKILFVFVRCP
jgi:hypothetical protein